MGSLDFAKASDVFGTPAADGAAARHLPNAFHHLESSGYASEVVIATLWAALLAGAVVASIVARFMPPVVAGLVQ
jgi:hypothetical protein